jgi:hypothetical protein
MKDKLKTICYVFPYDLNTRLTFIVSLFMIFRLCFFSCYNMVAKFLLSRLCLSCPCFKFFDPNTQCLLRWSRLWWCMSPQKLFFYYHLPTWGRAGVKLGDAWYVSNVSIIFDAPCLFYTICSCFVYTSWRFYAIFGTNLLTRCHSVSSLFSAVLCFRKATQEIFSELDETKTETPILSGGRTGTKREPEGGQRAPSPPGAWPRP